MFQEWHIRGGRRYEKLKAEAITKLQKAAKTHNVYEVNKAMYDKLMRDNVTSTYAKCDDRTEHAMNSEAKSITEKLKIDDRVEIIAHKDAYITKRS